MVFLFLRCAIRQTETGSIVITPFPGAIETKPGSATVPFFGIEPAILDPVTGKVSCLDTLCLNCKIWNAGRNWSETMLRESLLSRSPGRPLLARSTKIINDTSRLTWRWNMYANPYLILSWLFSSHTLDCSIRETELRVMTMDIFGLKDVSMVRRFTCFFFSIWQWFFLWVDVINVSGHRL